MMESYLIILIKKIGNWILPVGNMNNTESPILAIGGQYLIKRRGPKSQWEVFFTHQNDDEKLVNHEGTINQHQF